MSSERAARDDLFGMAWRVRLTRCQLAVCPDVQCHERCPDACRTGHPHKSRGILGDPPAFISGACVHFVICVGDAMEFDFHTCYCWRSCCWPRLLFLFVVHFIVNNNANALYNYLPPDDSAHAPHKNRSPK